MSVACPANSVIRAGTYSVVPTVGAPVTALTMSFQCGGWLLESQTATLFVRQCVMLCNVRRDYNIACVGYGLVQPGNRRRTMRL